MSIELFKKIEPNFTEITRRIMMDAPGAMYADKPHDNVKTAIRAGFWRALLLANAVQESDVPFSLFDSVPPVARKWYGIEEGISEGALKDEDGALLHLLALRQQCDPDERDDDDETLDERASRYTRDIILKNPETVLEMSLHEYGQAVLASEQAHMDRRMEELTEQQAFCREILKAMEEHGVSTMQELIALGVVQFGEEEPA